MAMKVTDAFQSRDREGAVSDCHVPVTFYGVPMALRAADGHESHRSFQSRDCEGVPLALRAAYRHERHRALQSRDRKEAVSCRAELVTFYGAVPASQILVTF